MQRQVIEYLVTGADVQEVWDAVVAAEQPAAVDPEDTDAALDRPVSQQTFRAGPAAGPHPHHHLHPQPGRRDRGAPARAGRQDLARRVEVLNVDRLAYRVVRDAEGAQPRLLWQTEQLDR